jgi:hypothetical protein
MTLGPREGGGGGGALLMLNWDEDDSVPDLSVNVLKYQK